MRSVHCIVMQQCIPLHVHVCLHCVLYRCQEVIRQLCTYTRQTNSSCMQWNPLTNSCKQTSAKIMLVVIMTRPVQRKGMLLAQQVYTTVAESEACFPHAELSYNILSQRHRLELYNNRRPCRAYSYMYMYKSIQCAICKQIFKGFHYIFYSCNMHTFPCTHSFTQSTLGLQFSPTSSWCSLGPSALRCMYSLVHCCSMLNIIVNKTGCTVLMPRGESITVLIKFSLLLLRHAQCVTLRIQLGTRKTALCLLCMI